MNDLFSQTYDLNSKDKRCSDLGRITMGFRSGDGNWDRTVRFCRGNLRSKRFRGVSEQKKSEERNFRSFSRAKNGARANCKLVKQNSYQALKILWSIPNAYVLRGESKKWERGKKFSKSWGLSASVSFLPLPLPLSHFFALASSRGKLLSPHFSRGQNFENPVLRTFFCSETPRKRLLRRPL